MKQGAGKKRRKENLKEATRKKSKCLHANWTGSWPKDQRETKSNVKAPVFWFKTPTTEVA